MFNQTRTLVQKYGAKIADGYREIGIVTGVALAPVLSLAQTAGDPFTEAKTAADAKIELYAGALVGTAAVAVAFMIALKYVKKIPRAA